MKERVLSNCERKFILESALECRRLDGRQFMEYRNFEVLFGADYGSCMVSLGETKVLSQVSYEIEEPKKSKPNEGLVFVNVEIGSMAAPHFETGRQNNLAVRVSRFLEKGIKESGCLDLEALCIVADDKVWVIRIDISILNYDGNIHSCCSFAALASLFSMRIPQVTLEDLNITIHSVKEKSPLPLSLNHFPVAVTFAIYHNGTVAFADPTDLEERVKESELVFYMNSFRELCSIHFGGKPVNDADVVLRYSSEATILADDFVKRIKAASEEFDQKRLKLMSQIPGFVECINLDRILAASQDRTSIALRMAKLEIADNNDLPSEEDDNGEEFSPVKLNGTYTMPSTDIAEFGDDWKPAIGRAIWSREDGECSSSSSESGESIEEEVEVVKTITEKDRIIDKIELSGESEEEETVVVQGNDLA